MSLIAYHFAGFILSFVFNYYSNNLRISSHQEAISKCINIYNISQHETVSLVQHKSNRISFNVKKSIPIVKQYTK